MLLCLRGKGTSRIQNFQIIESLGVSLVSVLSDFPTDTFDLPVEEQPRHLQTKRDD